jgi:hypothetical protein
MSYVRKPFTVIATCCLGLLSSYPAFSFGPNPDGTNPYIVAFVHLRADQTKKDDLLVHIEMLKKKYGASWDGQIFRDRRPNLLSAGPPSAVSDDVTIRMSFHSTDLPALRGESGVTKVEPIPARAF